jgi:hypothetical protein
MFFVFVVEVGRKALRYLPGSVVKGDCDSALPYSTQALL